MLLIRFYLITLIVSILIVSLIIPHHASSTSAYVELPSEVDRKPFDYGEGEDFGCSHIGHSQYEDGDGIVVENNIF